jgi:hypothetical protein
MVAGAAMLFAASATARTAGVAANASASSASASASNGGGYSADLSRICGASCIPHDPVRFHFARLRPHLRHCGSQADEANLYGYDRESFMRSCLREESLAE